MNNISTARGFERMLAEESAAWPPELQAKGQKALLALKMIVGQEREFAASQAIREATAADLMDFAASHAEWKASR